MAARLGAVANSRSSERTECPIFFDIHDGEGQFRDDAGTMLQDAQEARRAAISILPNIARDELADGDRRVFVAIVRDESGTLIFRATLTPMAEWLE